MFWAVLSALLMKDIISNTKIEFYGNFDEDISSVRLCKCYIMPTKDYRMSKSIDRNYFVKLEI